MSSNITLQTDEMSVVHLAASICPYFNRVHGVQAVTAASLQWQNSGRSAYQQHPQAWTCCPHSLSTGAQTSLVHIADGMLASACVPMIRPLCQMHLGSSLDRRAGHSLYSLQATSRLSAWPQAACQAHRQHSHSSTGAACITSAIPGPAEPSVTRGAAMLVHRICLLCDKQLWPVLCAAACWLACHRHNDLLCAACFSPAPEITVACAVLGCPAAVAIRLHSSRWRPGHASYSRTC